MCRGKKIYFYNTYSLYKIYIFSIIYKVPSICFSTYFTIIKAFNVIFFKYNILMYFLNKKKNIGILPIMSLVPGYPCFIPGYPCLISGYSCPIPGCPCSIPVCPCCLPGCTSLIQNNTSEFSFIIHL